MPDLSRENELIKLGHRDVAGIDEAGRGPLAGPVSVSAVVLPNGYSHEWLDDSKKTTPHRRDILFDEITNDPSISWSHVFAHEPEIDAKNILGATHAAMARAAEELYPKPDYFLIDGLPVPSFPFPSEGVVKGDGKSLSIAAASIIAKVMRDRLMIEYAEKYPEYGFEQHKGYGTKQHLEALKKHGPCPIHRRSFSPVSQLELEL